MIDFLEDNFSFVLIIVFFGIYEQSVGYLKRRLVEKYKDKIANAKDSQEAMKLRQDYKYKKGNIVLFARFVVIVFIIAFSWLKEHDFNIYTILYIGFYCVLEFVFSYRHVGERDFMESVSTYTKQGFLQEHEHFILYLRSFETDQYGNALFGQVKETGYDGGVHHPSASIIFTESLLVDALKRIRKLPVCAIGWPQEADQPEKSSIRIYADNDSWQEDVIDLIKLAKVVYVLVSSRESCLWEINQLEAFKDKTVFIIDDINEFDYVLSALGPNTFLREIPEELSGCSHVFCYWEDDKCVFGDFDFSAWGYEKLVFPAMKKLLPKPLILDGLFDRIRDVFNSGDWKSDDDGLSHFCAQMAKECPFQINSMLSMVGCAYSDKKLTLSYEIDSQCVNAAKKSESVFKWLVAKKFIDDIGQKFRLHIETQHILVEFRFSKDSGDEVMSFKYEYCD